MRSPSSVMLPACGRSSPDSAFSVVVLPAPFAPISATISPFGTSNVRFPTTVCTLP